jgi:hypothetical protein
MCIVSYRSIGGLTTFFDKSLHISIPARLNVVRAGARSAPAPLRSFDSAQDAQGYSRPLAFLIRAH